VSGLGVGDVVLAALALNAVRADEAGRDQPRIQPHHAQPATPVVGTRARLHRYQAARRQLRAPSQERVPRDRARHQPPARTIHCVDLNHVLRQVHTGTHDQRKQNPCDVCHGTFPVQSQGDDFAVIAIITLGA